MNDDSPLDEENLADDFAIFYQPILIDPIETLKKRADVCIEEFINSRVQDSNINIYSDRLDS